MGKWAGGNPVPSCAYGQRIPYAGRRQVLTRVYRDMAYPGPTQEPDGAVSYSS